VLALRFLFAIAVTGVAVLFLMDGAPLGALAVVVDAGVAARRGRVRPSLTSRQAFALGAWRPSSHVARSLVQRLHNPPDR